MAPANTGKDNKSKIVVTRTDQQNNGTRSINTPKTRKFPSVLIKLTAPNREDTPAKCNEKIAKSTDIPACAILLDNGGYTVQPVPAPLSTKALDNNITSAGIKNQNLILFKRGKAISGEPSIRGTNQLPNPPIKTGITIKKNYNKRMGCNNNVKNLVIPN